MDQRNSEDNLRTIYCGTGRGLEGQAAALASVNVLRKLIREKAIPDMDPWVQSAQNGSYSVCVRVHDEISLEVPTEKSK